MDEQTVARWRDLGVLIQKDKALFILRMGVTGGSVTPEYLRFAAELAEKTGATLHLTTRQTVEIQNLPQDCVEDALEQMQLAGIPYAHAGPRLRTIVACPGAPVCRFSCGDTQGMANLLHGVHGDFSGLQVKVKISLTGCRNCCAKPQENDIGFVADGGNGYRVFVGGKLGRRPHLGEELKQPLPDADAVLTFVGRILVWLRENGGEKERLADVIDRLGREQFLSAMNIS